jgi:hypothetical protein
MYIFKQVIFLVSNRKRKLIAKWGGFFYLFQNVYVWMDEWTDRNLLERVSIYETNFLQFSLDFADKIVGINVVTTINVITVINVVLCERVVFRIVLKILSSRCGKLVFSIVSSFK